MIVVLLLGSFTVNALKVDLKTENDNNEKFCFESLFDDGDAVEDELIIGYDKDWYPAIEEICGSTGADTIDFINETELVQTEEGKYLRHVKLDLSGVGDMDWFNFMVNNYLDVEKFDFAEPNYIYKSCYVPNDPYWDGVDSDKYGTPGLIEDFEYQWGLKAMNVDKAWDRTKGVGTVTVAVLDTGLYIDHEDCPKNMGGARDFVNNDNNPDDLNGHGTHCAGIIAARMDNKNREGEYEGIAGIAPSCKIMPIKVLGEYGGTNWDISKGIIYAGYNGANVISMSLGGPLGSLLMDAAILYANKIGRSFIVAETGNE